MSTVFQIEWSSTNFLFILSSKTSSLTGMEETTVLKTLKLVAKLQSVAQQMIPLGAFVC